MRHNLCLISDTNICHVNSQRYLKTTSCESFNETIQIAEIKCFLVKILFQEYIFVNYWFLFLKHLDRLFMHLRPILILFKKVLRILCCGFLKKKKKKPYWRYFVTINTELAKVVFSFTKKVLSLRTSHFSRRERNVKQTKCSVVWRWAKCL